MSNLRCLHTYLQCTRLLTTREIGTRLEKETEQLAGKEHVAVERTVLTHIAQEIRKVNL